MSIFLFWLKRKKTATIDAISKSGSGEKPPMRKTAYKNSPMAEVQTLNTAGTRKLPPDGKVRGTVLFFRRQLFYYICPGLCSFQNYGQLD